MRKSPLLQHDAFLIMFCCNGGSSIPTQNSGHNPVIILGLCTGGRTTQRLKFWVNCFLLRLLPLLQRNRFSIWPRCKSFTWMSPFYPSLLSNGISKRFKLLNEWEQCHFIPSTKKSNLTTCFLDYIIGMSVKCQHCHGCIACQQFQEESFVNHLLRWQ